MMTGDSQPAGDYNGVEVKKYLETLSDKDLEEHDGASSSEDQSHSDFSHGSTSRSSGHTGSTGSERRRRQNTRVEIAKEETVAVVRSKTKMKKEDFLILRFRPEAMRVCCCHHLLPRHPRSRPSKHHDDNHVCPC